MTKKSLSLPLTSPSPSPPTFCLMPKSKKNQRVNLTQTGKKDRDHKSKIVTAVRESVDTFDNTFVFAYDNMRSNKFKDVRMEFRDSRIFMGKNKLLQLALGRTPEDEYQENMRHASKLCSGSVGLLMTNRPKKEVVTYFQNLSSEDFARAGVEADRTVTLSQEEVSIHPVSMVEQFRKLGLPVQVLEGKVSLLNGKSYQVCKKGSVLSAEACKILVHFGIKLAVFKINLKCCWNDGEFELL